MNTAFSSLQPLSFRTSSSIVPHTCRCKAASPDPYVRIHDTAKPKPQSGLLPSYLLHSSPRLSDYLQSVDAYPSPLLHTRRLDTFTLPEDIVLSEISLNSVAQPSSLQAFLKSGPRRTVCFENGVRAAIVSCGGICPGINTVIREITLCLFRYGASKVFGVRHGYRGFYNSHWRDLSEDDVEGLHKKGGSVLGSSRGGFDTQRIVDAIETRCIDQVYVIGGDGTIMGCKKIYEEIVRRRLKTSIISIPKTIDNDIAIIDKSFGFDTAVDEAQRAINAAYTEATSFPGGFAIVKLMGRNSGFIACHAALASQEVDCCLIPEDIFELQGPGGVLAYVERRLNDKGHCVVVIAEGVGNERFKTTDVGLHVLEEVKKYFKMKQTEISTKYLDPTYQIRAIPPTTQDNILCILMAHAAVHGAYAGYTGFSSGIVNSKNVLIPIRMLAGIQKKVDTAKSYWQRLKMSTGQPDWVLPEDNATMDGGDI